MKQCTVCHSKKRRSAFNKRKAGANGLDSQCRSCSNNKHRMWRKLAKNRNDRQEPRNPNKTKICPTCGVEKPFPEFGKQKYGKYGLGSCKKCHRKYCKEYRQRPEVQKKRRALWTEWDLKKKYGITVKDKNDIFARQGNICAICKSNKTTGRGWHIDHDHKTKKIRAILCHACNLLLGQAKDSKEVLREAIAYLTKHEK